MPTEFGGAEVVEILDDSTVVDVVQGAALREAYGQEEPPKRSAQVELDRVAAVGAAESLDASRNDAAVLGWAYMPIHIVLCGPGGIGRNEEAAEVGSDNGKPS